MVSFSAIMLFWYIFPVIVLFACNFLVSTFSLTERWKIKAPDLAIPFLFIGIHELSKDSYDESIMPYFVISILLLGVAVALFQAYYYGEILYRRYFKMFWRLTFFTNVCVVCVAYLAKYQSLSTVIKRGDNRGNTLWENVPHNSPLRWGFFVILGVI